MVRCISFLALFVSLPVLVTGCGRTPVAPPTYNASVTGAITLQGQPLGHADIGFLPLDEKSPPSGTKTDEQGKFKLGVANPGKYRVTVKKYVNASGETVDLNPPTDKEVDPALTPITPDQLTSVVSEMFEGIGSPLVVEIKAGSNDLPPLDVTGP